MDDGDEVQHDEVPAEVKAESVIAGVRAFAEGLPVTVEMRTYVNPYTDEVQGVVLTDLFADVPGNGAGGAVVKEMIRLAELAGVTVYTDADGPRSAGFYRKMGFERSTGRGHQLAWHPPLPEWVLNGDEEPSGAFGMR